MDFPELFIFPCMSMTSNENPKNTRCHVMKKKLSRFKSSFSGDTNITRFELEMIFNKILAFVLAD